MFFIINNYSSILSKESLSQALNIASKIIDKEEREHRVNAINDLNFSIKNYYDRVNNNDFLAEEWESSPKNWKRKVSSHYTNNKVWMRNFKDIDEWVNNLTIWKAHGNDIINRNFCNVPRQQAIALASIYHVYDFDLGQQHFILDQLLKVTDEIPSQSCKARSLIKIAKELPTHEAKKLEAKILTTIRDILKDISQLQLEYLNSTFSNNLESIYEKLENFPKLEFDKKFIVAEKIIDDIDKVLFPYPDWWQPTMIPNLDITRRVKQIFAVQKNNNISKKKYGEVLFKIPDKMKVGISKLVSIYIANKIDESLTDNVSLKAESVRITKLMKVDIKEGENNEFIIQKMSNETQPIEEHTYTQWKWKVTPLIHGNKKLIASINVIIKIEDNMKDKYESALEKEFNVEINPRYTTINFLKLNWKWIISAAIIPICIPVISQLFKK